MPSDTPFVDTATGELDAAQILSEAVPIGKLIGTFVALALVPSGLAFLALGNSVAGALMAVIAQFVLAVGAGITLTYVVARGVQLSGE